jgi:hypothetical protein
VGRRDLDRARERHADRDVAHAGSKFRPPSSARLESAATTTIELLAPPFHDPYDPDARYTVSPPCLRTSTRRSRAWRELRSTGDTGRGHHEGHEHRESDAEVS